MWIAYQVSKADDDYRFGPLNEESDGEVPFIIAYF
jgi:hypothetical protein